MKTSNAVKALAALAQESRLSIFLLLVEAGPDGLSAGTISDKLALASATLSFHLKELANASLIQARQAGRFIYYSADFDAMGELVSFLTVNCCKGSGDADCLVECQSKATKKSRPKI